MTAPTARPDVEETYPYAVAEGEPEPTRLCRQQEQRMIDRQKPGFDARQPVDVQQISPDRSCCLGRLTAGFAHGDRARLQAPLERPVHSNLSAAPHVRARRIAA